MTPRRHDRTADRILLSRGRRSMAAPQPAQRRASLWTLAGGILGSTILFWVMVHLGQASSETKAKAPQPPPSPAKPAAARPASGPQVPVAEPEDESKPLTPPSTAIQGPALDTPREVIDMLDLRKRDLDRREESVRQNEERLLMVKTEIEQLLSRNEALEKRMQAAQAKQAQQANDENAQQTKVLIGRERQAKEQKNQHQAQLAKIYESMPAEEAAARLERMPDRKAIEILRLVKGKTAGAILAQVKVDRAAKLTEQLLAQTQ